MTEEQLENKRSILKMLRSSLKDYEIRLKHDPRSTFFMDAVKNMKDYIKQFEDEISEGEKHLVAAGSEGSENEV